MLSRTENSPLPGPRLLAALLLRCPLHATPSSTAPDAAEVESGVQSFRIVIDRNIFNRNRIPAPQPGSADTGQQSDAAPEAADQLSLVGALIDEFGAVAFFSGSKAEFQSVTKRGDSIAGFTIEEIESERIVLECDGVKTVLAVGMSMAREEGGEWQIRETAGLAHSYAAPPTPSDSVGAKTEESDSASEVHRRMIERRQREANP